jgi:hypothetical protein
VRGLSISASRNVSLAFLEIFDFRQPEVSLASSRDLSALPFPILTSFIVNYQQADESKTVESAVQQADTR